MDSLAKYSSQFLVWSTRGKLLDKKLIRKQTRPQRTHFDYGLLHMSTVVYGAVQVLLTIQSICSPWNGHNILQNHTATSFYLPWVLGTAGNHGV